MRYYNLGDAKLNLLKFKMKKREFFEAQYFNIHYSLHPPIRSSNAAAWANLTKRVFTCKIVNC